MTDDTRKRSLAKRQPASLAKKGAGAVVAKYARLHVMASGTAVLSTIVIDAIMLFAGSTAFSTAISSPLWCFFGYFIGGHIFKQKGDKREAQQEAAGRADFSAKAASEAAQRAAESAASAKKAAMEADRMAREYFGASEAAKKAAVAALAAERVADDAAEHAQTAERWAASAAQGVAQAAKRADVASEAASALADEAASLHSTVEQAVTEAGEAVGNEQSNRSYVLMALSSANDSIGLLDGADQARRDNIQQSVASVLNDVVMKLHDGSVKVLIQRDSSIQILLKSMRDTLKAHRITIPQAKVVLEAAKVTPKKKTKL